MISYKNQQEEIANCITHGIGVIFGFIVTFLLLNIALTTNGIWLIVAAILYGVSIILLFLASTVYHLPSNNKQQKIFFQKLDHAAIYLLIAGTYSPFTLVLLRNNGWWGWSLFVSIWIMAILGIFIKLYYMDQFRKLSVAFYLIMGWLAIIAIKPLYDSLSLSGMYWLLGGGACYTIGVIFYKWRSLPFSHAIWHLLVLAGCICHFYCVLYYIYP